MSEGYRKKNKPSNLFLVEGPAVLQEYLRLAPDAVHSVVCRTDFVSKLEGALKEKVEQSGVDVATWMKRHGTIPSRAPIWGYVRILAKDETHLYSCLEEEPARVVLALDHIQDPRNLGAIARTAAFFGVKHIVVPKQRQVLLTDVSVGVAQGAFCYSHLYVVTNLNRTLQQLKSMNYWVVGADMGGRSYRERVLSYEQMVLVMGSEGQGLAQLTRKTCDLQVSIPSSVSTVQSLNVSVAAGILLSATTDSGHSSIEL